MVLNMAACKRSFSSIFGHGVENVLPTDEVDTVGSKNIPMTDHLNIKITTFGHSGSICYPNNAFT